MSGRLVPLQPAARITLRSVIQQRPIRHLPGRAGLRLTVAAATTGTGSRGAAEEPLTVTAVRRMTKPQVQEALKMHGLDTSGTKPVLVDRLWAALSADAEETGASRADADGMPEDDSNETNTDADALAEDEQEEPEATEQSITSLTQLKHMKKGTLQELLMQRGLPKTGNKGDLAERLWGAMQQSSQPGSTSITAEPATAASDGAAGAASIAAPPAPSTADPMPTAGSAAQPQPPPGQLDGAEDEGIVRSGRRTRRSRRWADDVDEYDGVVDPSLPTAMAAAPAVPPTGRSSVIAPDESIDDFEVVQDEGDVDDLLDTEYEDDAVEDQFENDFGDMPGAAQVMQDIAARGRSRTGTTGGERGRDWLDEPDAVEADESDASWMRPGRSDETAAERFARYTEGFSVEDEDAPPLPLEEDEDELAAAEAAAAADAASLTPMAPGDGSAADRDLEQLGELADDSTASMAVAEESYQVDGVDDLEIDEEELARLEQEMSSADIDDFGSVNSATAEQEYVSADGNEFGGGGRDASAAELINTGSGLPGSGTAELENQGAVTNAAADPLAAANVDDNAPLAPTFEPDGMAQLASVDADAELGSSGAAATQTLDALSDTDPADSLTQAAAGLGATPAQMAAVLDGQAGDFKAEVDSAFAADEAEPDASAAEAVAPAELVQPGTFALKTNTAAAAADEAEPDGGAAEAIAAAEPAQPDAFALKADSAAAAAAAAAAADEAEPHDTAAEAVAAAESAQPDAFALEADSAAAADDAEPAEDSIEAEAAPPAAGNSMSADSTVEVAQQSVEAGSAAAADEAATGSDSIAATDAAPPTGEDVTPADITAELAQQSVNAGSAAAAVDAEPAVPRVEPSDEAVSPAPKDAKPADITADVAQQSTEAPPSPPSAGGNGEGPAAEDVLPVSALEGGADSEAAAPLVAADETANPLTASAAAGVPGVDPDVSAESASEVIRAALAAEAEELEDLAQKAASKEAALALMRESVKRSESTGASNTEALAALSDQVAEMRSAQLDWQQNVLAGRLTALREDSERIAANDRLKEELGATLADLETKMETLDADLAARKAEAEKLQEALEAATGSRAPPPPAYNGTPVRAALGDGGSGGAAAAAGVPIDDGRLRAPIAAAAASEVPASRRPPGSKAFGVAVAAGLIGAIEAGRGFFGSMLRQGGGARGTAAETDDADPDDKLGES